MMETCKLKLSLQSTKSVSKAAVEGKVWDWILQDLEGIQPSSGKFDAFQVQKSFQSSLYAFMSVKNHSKFEVNTRAKGSDFSWKSCGQHLPLCRVVISAITDLSVVQISRYALQLLTAACRVHQEERGWMRHLLWVIFSDTVWSVAVQVSWTKEQMVVPGLNECTGRTQFRRDSCKFSSVTGQGAR